VLRRSDNDLFEIGHAGRERRQSGNATGRRWDLLTQNAAAAEIYGVVYLAERDGNILVFVLTKPAARRLFGSTWSNEAQRMVA
jgi:hypothetical protein